MRERIRRHDDEHRPIKIRAPGTRRSKVSKPVLSPKQAKLLVEGLSIDMMMSDGEEVRLLKSQNPDLFDAYLTLMRLSESEGVGT